MVHVSSVFTQISHFTLDVTTNKYLHSAAGNAKIYLKNYSNSVTPLSHSWPKQSSKRVISLIHCSFLQVHWHYSFHFLEHCFFHFFWTLFLPLSWTLFLPLSWTLSFFSGDRSLSIYFPQFVGLHPTVSTGLISSGRACLGVPAIKSAVPMSPHPRVNLLVPVPAATFH